MVLSIYRCGGFVLYRGDRPMCAVKIGLRVGQYHYVIMFIAVVCNYVLFRGLSWLYLIVVWWLYY